MSSFWLEYTKDGERREFSFDSPSVTVGRDKSADFVLDHPTVSRQHALIRVGPTGPQLVVLSRGGLTAIDGGQVQGEMPLFDGSEIHFGQLAFTFRSNNAPAKPAPAWQAPAQPVQQQMQQPAQPAQPASAGSADGSGGWGQTSWDDVPAAAPSAPAAAPVVTDDNAIVTWDQIAASADAADAASNATDFQRIQAAQAKADKQTKGNNPIIIYGGILGIVAVMAFAFWPKPPKEIITEIDMEKTDKPFISWEKQDLNCVGRADCREMAVEAYKLGTSLNDQANADITNPYNAYKQLDKARELLKAGGIEPIPDDMADLIPLQTQMKSGLDATFKKARLEYRLHRSRKNYKKMAAELTKLQAFFPDTRCLFNQWAIEKEREMKDEGIYPVATLY